MMKAPKSRELVYGRKSYKLGQPTKNILEVRYYEVLVDGCVRSYVATLFVGDDFNLWFSIEDVNPSAGSLSYIRPVSIIKSLEFDVFLKHCGFEKW